MTSTGAIIVAGGRGSRFGGDKLFASLGGIPVLERTLSIFEKDPRVSRVVLVLRADLVNADWGRRFQKLAAVVPGGRDRHGSVRAGFFAVEKTKPDIVLVHDAVRPLAGRDLIARVIDGALRWGAAAPVLPLEDTIKKVKGGRISGTLDREELGRVQTPQAFRREVLAAAMQQAGLDGFRGTDEASLVERMGGEVAAVAGEPRNLKITTPEDLIIAEALLETENGNRI